MFTKITSIDSNGLVLLALALSFTVVLLANAVPLARRLRLMDNPDGARKHHARPTPLMGGVAIWAGMAVWIIGTLAIHAAPTSADQQMLLAILCCGSAVWVVGFIDDHTSLSPSVRMLALITISIVAMLLDSDIVPHALNWLSMASMPLPVWAAWAFIAVAMAGFVNAVNMADGQNGVVGGMMMIWAVCLMFVTSGVTFLLATALLITVACFFLFNIMGQTFIGDSGTYGIGFVFGLLGALAHNRFGVSVETVCVWFFIPVVDCLRLLIGRARKGVSPMQADRDHFHHRLQDRVGPHAGLAVYLAAVGVSSIVASLAPQLALLCLILLATFYMSFAWLTGAPEAETRAEDQVLTGVVPFHGRDRKKARK